MPSEITIVSIDIIKNDPNFTSWESLSAKDKIDKLIERIEKTRKALLELEEKL